MRKENGVKLFRRFSVRYSIPTDQMRRYSRAQKRFFLTPDTYFNIELGHTIPGIKSVYQLVESWYLTLNDLI